MKSVGVGLMLLALFLVGLSAGATLRQGNTREQGAYLAACDLMLDHAESRDERWEALRWCGDHAVLVSGAEFTRKLKR